MHGRHIALFPLPAKSHINPYLGLCPELVRRGYRVTVATDESHANLVVPAGAEPVIFESCKLKLTIATSGLHPSDSRCWEELGDVILPWLLNYTALTVRQLDKFYKENRPDLIIYDADAYAGRILGKRLHSPVIQYCADFIQKSAFLQQEGGVSYDRRSIVEFSRLLDSFLWAYGFEETNNFWHSEDLNFYSLPRAFHFDADSLDSRRFCFVGPFLDRPFNPMWKNRSGGKRIILVSAITGSLDADYFNKIIEALSESDYHVILSVGEHFPTSELRTLPENFEINRCASHLEILPHTDLHFYSGGASGTLEGLYFGVPLIAVPTFAWNYALANRLADLGWAINLPLHTLTSQTIRERVETVLHDDAFLGRVKQMRDVVRSSGGSVMAVDRIEEYLAAHG